MIQHSKKAFKIAKLTKLNCKAKIVKDLKDNNIISIELQTFVQFANEDATPSIKKIKSKLIEAMRLRNKKIVPEFFNTFEIANANSRKNNPARRFGLQINLGCMLASNCSQIAKADLQTATEGIVDLISLFGFEDTVDYKFHLKEK